MLMQILSLQTHGEIYLPDCLSIVKVIQTTCASPERLVSEELGWPDGILGLDWDLDKD